MNELSFTLPGTGWVDTSTHRLSIEAPDGSQVSLDVARERALPTEELAERVEQDLRRHGRTKRGFERVRTQDFSTPAATGIVASFRTVTPEGALHHELAYVPLPGALLVFGVSGKVAHAAACSELLGQALGSIRLES